MKTKKTVTVVSVERGDNENIENSVYVNCESIMDIENMTVSEILNSGGNQKFVFFLRNCANKIKVLQKALVDKQVDILVFKIPVSDIIADALSVNISIDGVDNEFNSLTYSTPNIDMTEEEAKGELRAQIVRRVQSGDYTINYIKNKDNDDD